MHYRTPSTVSRNTNGSTMRRRSGGSMAYQNLVHEDAPAKDSASAANITRDSMVVLEEYHVYATGLDSQDSGGDSTTLDPSLTQTQDPELPDLQGTRPPPNSIEALPSLPSSADSRSVYTEESQVLESTHSASKGGCESSTAISPGTTSMLQSMNSGHKGLIHAVGTTKKFTNKWPVPRNAHRFMPDLKASNEGTGAGAGGMICLEEGQGLTWRNVVKWTLHKWCLLFSVTTVFLVGLSAMTIALMTWFNTWQNSQVMVVADNDILILITLAASFFLFTSLIGVTGTLLNSRPILAVYAFLLWPAFLSMMAVGYTSYRRFSYSLENKLNLTWSRFFTPTGRRVIQDSLNCCGFYSAMHEASPSKTCYLRAPLPGCKADLYSFERNNLRAIWSATFALVPVHLANMIIALLCSNHVTKRFGDGFTPILYRLTPMDVKADADKLLVGGLDHLPTVPYSGAPTEVTSEKS